MKTHRRALMVSLTETMLVAIALFLVPLTSSGQQGDDLMDTSAVITYTVAPSGDAVHVTVDHVFVNRDPATKKTSRGYEYIYALPIYVPNEAKNLMVQRGDGRRLRPRLIKNWETETEYKVETGRRTTYGKQVRLVYSYDIKGSQKEPYELAFGKAIFPMWTVADDNQFRVIAPPTFAVILDDARCAQVENQVLCSNVQWAEEPIIAEAVQATANQTTTGDVYLSEGTIRVSMRHYPHHGSWARETLDVLREIAPVIERTMGFPYPGSSVINVIEVTLSDTDGALGNRFGDTIKLVAGGPPDVAAHELAHMWQLPTYDLWLVEGWAQWASLHALSVSGIVPEYTATACPVASKQRIPLSIWIQPADRITPPDFNDKTAQYLYNASFCLIDELVSRYGLETLAAVHSQLLSTGEVFDSQGYLAALKYQGADATDLWRKYVW